MQVKTKILIELLGPRDKFLNNPGRVFQAKANALRKLLRDRDRFLQDFGTSNSRLGPDETRKKMKEEEEAGRRMTKMRTRQEKKSLIPRG